MHSQALLVKVWSWPPLTHHYQDSSISLQDDLTGWQNCLGSSVNTSPLWLVPFPSPRMRILENWPFLRGLLCGQSESQIKGCKCLFTTSSFLAGLLHSYVMSSGSMSVPRWERKCHRPYWVSIFSWLWGQSGWIEPIWSYLKLSTWKN